MKDDKVKEPCLFCGGKTFGAVVRSRKLGTKIVTEVRKCHDCKRHSLRVRKCE